jgi:cytochrome b561
MNWKNSTSRYGIVTKFFHWAVFLLFVNQYIVARIMLTTPVGETSLGYTQGELYNWHKSIGLILLGLALLRYTWRRTTGLPDWDATLTHTEKKIIHWLERILYFCMIAMPLSGYFFVMAGGYGVNFFSRWQLPNFIGEHEWLAHLAEWTHITLAVVIVVAVAVHLTLNIRHAIVYKNGYLRRMLPFTHQ